MKAIASVLSFAIAAFACAPSFAQPPLLAGSELMVGYYGRPGAASLGVLGEHSIDALVPIVKHRAAEYARASGTQKVMPAFHLIYGLASAAPGRDKDYLLPLSHEKVMEYIDAARSHGFAVILDTQLGELTPEQAVQPVLRYLEYDNVHLAIDPEFEVHGLDVRPGKVIGHITGEQVNRVQAAMSGFLEKNAIKSRKVLIVHMFTPRMVTDKAAYRKYDQIDVVMNLDGHGSPRLKVDIYNQLYTQRAAARVAGGFKLFFREDKPSMMTPRQVLGMEPVGDVKIIESPRYINFQ